MAISIPLGNVIGQGKVSILGKYANRHGLIAGATGTGKTVTLQSMAEGFSKAGVPVFLADIKGDVSGLAISGKAKACPVVFWDCFGKDGHRACVTVEEIGPELFARLLELSEAQSGCLEITFSYAKVMRLKLNTLADMRRVLLIVLRNKEAIEQQYGLVSASSVAAVQRSLIKLERMGGNSFFGSPVLDIHYLMRKDGRRGIINILAADKLVHFPQIYSMFMLWLLTKLYTTLPEVGDLPKPKLVLFIDEAHLLFTDCPKFIFQRIEQVVRLIRSKGVGIYFVTQTPMDIPANILAQLGNRVQHALRGATLADQRAIRAAAETFPSNPNIDAAGIISVLKVGQALVSTIGDNGMPLPVEAVKIKLPDCRLGMISPAERASVIVKTPLPIKDSKQTRSMLFTEDWPWCQKRSLQIMIAFCVVMIVIGWGKVIWLLLSCLLIGIYGWEHDKTKRIAP